PPTQQTTLCPYTTLFRSERQRRKEADKALAEKILTEGVEAFVDYWEDLPLFGTQKNLPETVQSKIREERLYQTKWGLSMALVFRSEEHTSELQSRFDLVC